eukprot:Pompholyxophrys_punicea_v1_NODE_424_length_2000_cov_2.667866.p1 type:complete len:149 gc:universal NODE_424_length_2000_cov_2.667866:961-1407(+)
MYNGYIRRATASAVFKTHRLRKRYPARRVRARIPTTRLTADSEKQPDFRHPRPPCPSKVFTISRFASTRFHRVSCVRHSSYPSPIHKGRRPCRLGRKRNEANLRPNRAYFRIPFPICHASGMPEARRGPRCPKGGDEEACRTKLPVLK